MFMVPMKEVLIVLMGLYLARGCGGGSTMRASQANQQHLHKKAQREHLASSHLHVWPVPATLPHIRREASLLSGPDRRAAADQCLSGAQPRQETSPGSLVVHGRGWAGQVEDLVHLQQDLLHHVVPARCSGQSSIVGAGGQLM